MLLLYLCMYNSQYTIKYTGLHVVHNVNTQKTYFYTLNQLKDNKYT